MSGDVFWLSQLRGGRRGACGVGGGELPVSGGQVYYQSIPRAQRSLQGSNLEVVNLALTIY